MWIVTAIRATGATIRAAWRRLRARCSDHVDGDDDDLRDEMAIW